MSFRLLSLGFVTACFIGTLGHPAEAVPVTTSAGPIGGWDITARAGEGRTGFALAARDAAVVTGEEPDGPVRRSGCTQHFELTYSSATGTVSFSVDFNRNGTFGRRESLTYTFDAFAGRGFSTVGLLIQGDDEGGIELDNLTLNGAELDTSGPTRRHAIEQSFSETTGVFRDILISGDLILPRGDDDEHRPQIWLRLGGDVRLVPLISMPDEVPEPATLAVLGLGLVGLLVARRPMRRAGGSAGLTG